MNQARRRTRPTTPNAIPVPSCPEMPLAERWVMTSARIGFGAMPLRSPIQVFFSLFWSGTLSFYSTLSYEVLSSSKKFLLWWIGRCKEIRSYKGGNYISTYGLTKFHNTKNLVNHTGSFFQLFELFDTMYHDENARNECSYSQRQCGHLVVSEHYFGEIVWVMALLLVRAMLFCSRMRICLIGWLGVV